MRAAVYSRKSRFTGRGESTENQIQLCTEYGMKYLGIEESGFIIYEDEGYSGGSTNRPQFKRLMKDAADGKFDTLICYRLDRISRNVTDFSSLINELNNCNISFISIREQFDTSTPMGRAMMYIASVFSQLERETIAERIRDNMLQLARTGRWLGGVTPIGFKSEEMTYFDTNQRARKMFRLVPAVDEIKIVKLIFDEYLSLKSITKVEKFLCKNSILSRNGVSFSRYSIRFILSNPVYAVADSNLYGYLTENGYGVSSESDEFKGLYGLAAYNRTNQDKARNSCRCRDNSDWILAVGLHEGIIDSGTWIAVQEQLLHNKPKAYRRVKNSQALLSGILYCSECGSFMRPKTVNREGKDGKKAFYYICEMKEKSCKTGCNIKNINGNIIDEAVIEKLSLIMQNNPPVFDGVHLEKFFKSSGRIQSSGGVELNGGRKRSIPVENGKLRSKISELDTAFNNLTVAIAKGAGEDALSVILGKIGELAMEKSAIERQLPTAEAEEAEEMEAAKEADGTDMTEAAEAIETANATKSNKVNKAIKVTKATCMLESASMEQCLSGLEKGVWSLMDVNARRRMIKSMADRILWDGGKVEIYLHGAKAPFG